MADFDAFKQMEQAENWLYESWSPWIIAGVGGLLFALKTYMRGAQYSSNTKVTGKIAIVTGANQGVGYETALDLATRGAIVYLGCRDETAGKEAVQKIQKSSRSKKVHYIPLDLSSFDSIHSFANAFKKKETNLHILVNNAGLMLADQDKTKEGFESQFGINYVGHFLLTQLLLDVLKESAPSRIICVGAAAFQLGAIDFDDINWETREYVAGQAYAMSKLAVMLFMRKMAKKLEGTGVTINAVNPGVANTNAYRTLPFKKNGFVRLSFMPLLYLFMKGASDGAQTSIFCAVNEELEKVSGKYYVDCEETEISENGQDDEAADKLWKLTKQWTKL